MRIALADLERRIGGLPTFRYRLASSSAAGGLLREVEPQAALELALAHLQVL